MADSMKPAGSKPTAAFVLVLIGGIFVLIGAGVALVAGLFLHGISGLASNTATNSSLNNAGSTTTILGGVSILSGLIMILSSVMMYTNVRKVKMWAAIALVFTIISLTTLGGFVLGFILGLIGSILGLVYKQQ